MAKKDMSPEALASSVILPTPSAPVSAAYMRECATTLAAIAALIRRQNEACARLAKRMVREGYDSDAVARAIRARNRKPKGATR
jgi:hypothetical protein